MRANTGIRGRFSTSRMMLPKYMLSISPQTRSGRSRNSIGPGGMPCMMKAAKRTAVVPEPGTPKVNMGTKAPQVAALFAASGAAIPSTAPLPKRCGVLDSFFSVA